jgi:hypothetical protein
MALATTGGISGCRHNGFPASQLVTRSSPLAIFSNCPVPDGAWNAGPDLLTLFAIPGDEYCGEEYWAKN